MKREEALERLEFRIRHSCPQANGDNIGDCDKCWRYPCNDMKALDVLKDHRSVQVQCKFCGATNTTKNTYWFICQECKLRNLVEKGCDAK